MNNKGQNLFSNFSVILLFFFVTPNIGLSSNEVEVKLTPHFDHTHRLWEAVLKKHIVSGSPNLFNYQSLKKNTEEFNRYLQELSSVTNQEYEGFSKNEKIAFWINSYNAFTIKLILMNYPVSSIKKIGGWLQSPWRMSFFSILGKKTTLDEIEHEVLRKQFKESRIHFALNCASLSCPSLQENPYLGHTLEGQLEKATQQFLRTPTRNDFDLKSHHLRLSKIFDWYQTDFGRTDQDLKNFIAPRLSENQKIQTEIRSPSTKIEFFDYDWRLNEN